MMGRVSFGDVTGMDETIAVETDACFKQ